MRYHVMILEAPIRIRDQSALLHGLRLGILKRQDSTPCYLEQGPTSEPHY